jgi:hypothetical protein
MRRWGHDDALLVTFNYDRLLDMAVSEIRRRDFQSLDDYVALKPFVLYKVHGSAGWGRVVAEPPDLDPHPWKATARLIAEAPSIKTTEEYVVRNDDRPIIFDQARRALVPAVVIPMQSKQQFECPDDHL